MKYEGFTTFKTVQNEGILTVTFDFGAVNVQGQEMLADLNLTSKTSATGTTWSCKCRKSNNQYL